MITIKNARRKVEEFSYFIFYEWVEQPGAGFHFPCNDQGEINFNKMKPAAVENYEKCESDEHEVIYRGLQRSVNRYTEPAVGKCHSGSEVLLESNTNECSKCQRLYNSVGLELSDPSHWGEETGEHPSDVKRWTA